MILDTTSAAMRFAPWFCLFGSLALASAVGLLLVSRCGAERSWLALESEPSCPRCTLMSSWSNGSPT